MMKTQHELPARDRILTTAHALFYQNGIRATGIDRIIAEAKVTKVTFYRHFPSKNDLILAFLDFRHQRWIHWFNDALERHGGNMDALVPSLAEWFNNAEFRGCAFINTVGELANELPDVRMIALRHKQDMTSIIASLLPSSLQQDALSTTLAVAVDGAIVRAQYDESADPALQALSRIIAALVPQSGHTQQT